MKVRELIEELQKLDPELVVLKQKDDEGNGYSKVYGAADDCYSDNIDTYDIEVLRKQDVAEYVEDYELDEADFKQICVIY